MIYKSMSKNGFILMAFALATTAAVAIVNDLTKERIAKQNQQQLVKLLSEVLPNDLYDNQLTENCALINDERLSKGEPSLVYRATKNGEPVAVILRHTTQDGYNGKIAMITAIDKTGVITGVRVTEHSETPGLGDKVELAKSQWILSFNDQTLANESDPTFKVKRDGGQFDQFTGATITPRAVVNSVASASWFGQTEFAAIFAAPNACGEQQ